MDDQIKDIPQGRADIISYEKLFGQCLEAKKLNDNQIIPIGGRSQFSNETDIGVIGDFQYFRDLFQQIHEAAPSHNTESLKKWLESQKLDIDPKLVSILDSFTKKLQENYPSKPENTNKRHELYFKSRTPPKISEVFEAQAQECGEIAALAQAYLQSEGIDSSYFSGDVLWNKEHEFSEKHSFIVIRHNGKQVIFDPTNPTKTTTSLAPSIYTTSADFENEVRKNGKRFVTTNNILTKKDVYFGVNNGTNVSERNIV